MGDVTSFWGFLSEIYKRHSKTKDIQSSGIRVAFSKTPSGETLNWRQIPKTVFDSACWWIATKRWAWWHRTTTTTMGLHNHLHTVQNSSAARQNMQRGGLYPFVDVFGVIGMIFTLVGNYTQTKETFELFLNQEAGETFWTSLPRSFYFTLLSDLCLIAYGVVDDNIIIAIYAALNTMLMLGTMAYMYYLWRDKQRCIPTFGVTHAGVPQSYTYCIPTELHDALPPHHVHRPQGIL